MAKIAIVEDDQKLANIYKNRLTLEGYEVSTLDNNTAYDDLNRNKPDLLLLDIFMPNVSGLTILEKLRQDHVFDLMPILILTNDDRAEDMERAVKLGIHGYVLKAETSLDALVSRVRDVLSDKAASSAPPTP